MHSSLDSQFKFFSGNLECSPVFVTETPYPKESQTFILMLTKKISLHIDVITNIIQSYL